MQVILSILMLGGFALVAGAVLLVRRGERRKAALMVIAALVLFGNVAILVWPMPQAVVPG